MGIDSLKARIVLMEKEIAALTKVVSEEYKAISFYGDPVLVTEIYKVNTARLELLESDLKAAKALLQE